MSRKRGPAIAGILALFLLVAGCDRGGPSETDGDAPAADGVQPPAGESLAVPVDLYFPTPGGGLAPEARELPPSDDPRELIRAVVEALLVGPREEGSGSLQPLPAEFDLDDVYLGADGVVFLDLRTPELREPPPVGSTEERQIVYSLVNSVALNVAEARRVVLLWNGRQRLTFAGHLDTSRPLAPETELVVQKPVAQ